MIYEGQPFATPGDALAHYGVKGQKWGVRKQPETSSRKSSSDVVGVDPVTATIGAAYIAFILGGIALSIRDIIRMKNDSGKKFAEKTAKVPWKEKPSLKQAKTVDDIQKNVVMQINPGYGAPGTKMNCRRATFAYEMRRRGYDVQATRSHYATGQTSHGLSLATKGFGGQKAESIWGQKMIGSEKSMRDKTPDEKAEMVFTSLKSQPNGARGELGVGWDIGGGHSMAYEVVNNRPVVFDTQSREIYRDAKSFTKFTDIMGEAAYTRTDNIELDEQFLRRWVKNVE